MANTLRFKRGLVSTIPTALAGEPLFTTDTFDLYIGNGTTNTRFQKYIASGTTSQLLRGDGSLLTMPIVLTSPSNGQVLKYNGTSWVNDSDAGITGSGTTNYLPKFTSASTLGNSTLQEVNGNLGLGSAPSNWTSFKALQIGGNSFVGFGTQAEIWNNSFFDGTFKYYGNGFATRYTAIDGTFQWYIAPNNVSGAGATATFTQAARITSGGNFIINNASTDNGLRFQVTGDGFFSSKVSVGTTSTNYTLSVSQNNLPTLGFIDPTEATDQKQWAFQSGITVGAGVFRLRALNDAFTNGQNAFVITKSGIAIQTHQWFTANTERMRLDASGNLGLGTSTINVSLLGRAITISSANSGLELTSATNVVQGTVQSNTNGLTLEGIGTSGMRFFTSASGATLERMRLDASGNLGLGVTPSAWATGVKAYEINSKGNALISGASTQSIITANAYFDGAWKYGTNGVASYYQQINAVHSWHNAISGTANAAITFTQAMTLDASGRLGIGSTSPTEKLDVNGTGIFRQILYTVGGVFGFGTAFQNSFHLNNNGTSYIGFNTGNLLIGNGADTGEKFQVTGTMRVSGASTFNGAMTLSINQNAGTLLNVSNTTSGTASVAYAQFQSSNGNLQLGKRSATTNAYKMFAANDSFIFNDNSGDIGILNDFSTGSIKMAAGGSSTAHFTIASTGAATFSSTAQAAGFITSGGAGYAVINSASNTVTALRPTGGGASIMSTNSNGLHIAVGTQAAGDLILASNNTERIRLSSNGFFSQLNATNPSASITDSYIQYSADVVAGNAAPHFRTENGAVIKLYQETTAVGNAIFSQGGGNAVLDDSTFAGYTLRQIVQALRNQGILQ